MVFAIAVFVGSWTPYKMQEIQGWFREAVVNTPVPFADISFEAKPDPRYPSLVATENTTRMYCFKDGQGQVALGRNLDKTIVCLFARICCMVWTAPAQHQDMISRFWKYWLPVIVDTFDFNYHTPCHSVGSVWPWKLQIPSVGRSLYAVVWNDDTSQAIFLHVNEITDMNPDPKLTFSHIIYFMF